MKRALNCFLIALTMVIGITSTSTSGYSQGNNRAVEAETKARNFLAQRGIPSDRVTVKHSIVDETGSHIRFSQFLNGVRVYGADIITHQRVNGRFSEATGELFRGSAPTSRPSFGKEEAEQFAARDLWDATHSSAELVYYPQGKGLVLAYMVDVSNTDNPLSEPRREMVILNAETGEVIDRWDNLQTAAATGTGYGFYSGHVSSFPIDLTSGTYSMFDVPRNGKTYDLGNKTCPPTGCRSNGTLFTSTDNIFGTNGSLSDRQSVGVDAHYFASQTLAYFANAFGRNGIDGNNNLNLKYKFMVSRTHYGNNYNNAFWDGSAMTYGDGDGSTYRPFDALDVVGHEMTHGITERTSNLTYSNESGAANESFSDIFGAVIEFKLGTLTGAGGIAYPADWWIGEDLYYSNNPSNPTRGIRNMSNTHAEGDPDHYSERYTGTGDNGGVHINSGIQNYLFYLLVVGGTNHADTTGTVVSAIGLDAAAAIAFDADTKYCIANDTYQKVANAWVNAAKFRYGAGSVEAQQTYNAWKAAGRTPTVAP